VFNCVLKAATASITDFASMWEKLHFCEIFVTGSVRASLLKVPVLSPGVLKMDYAEISYFSYYI